MKELSSQIHLGVERETNVVATFWFPLAQGFSNQPGHPEDGKWCRTTCVLAVLSGRRVPPSTSISKCSRAVLRLHKVFLIPPQWHQGYKCCRGTFFCTGTSSLFTGNHFNPGTLQHKPSLAIECNNHIPDSYELLCKGKRPLLKPMPCPFTICVCCCLIYIE